jgi:hemolysin activation/secretion protein
MGLRRRGVPPFLPVLAALTGAPAFAQPALPNLAPPPPPLPGIIERETPAEPPRLGPRLAPPEPARVTGPGEGRSIRVNAVRIAGNTALPDAALRGAVSGLEAQEATLARIEDARLALLRGYRDFGFPYVAVTAGLAPRADGSADLTFSVIEGYVAEVALEGGIGPASAQVLRFLRPLEGQRPLSAAALERALLLATDIPGVEARGVLRPIEGEPGALQLVVRLSRQAVSGFFNLDNRGYDLTGAWQGLLSAQLNSVTALGERTEIAVLGSEGGRQGFVQGSGEVYLGSSGLRLRGFVGTGHATPGSPLSAIGYRGDTTLAGVALAYPVIRSRPLNLAIAAQADGFDSVVDIRPGDQGRLRQSSDSVRALRLSVDFAAQDAVFAFAPAAAVSTAVLRFHQGVAALGASDSGSPLASRFGSDFGFTRIVAEASRSQPLFSPAEGWLVSLYGLVAGQWSNDLLPPAERFFLGGNRLGRGFYAGQVAGDRALAGTLEVQANRVWDVALPQGALRLGTQFYLFRDGGKARDNGPLALERSLESWGGGVRMQFDDRVQLDLEAVRRLTRTPDGPRVAELAADAFFLRLLLRY